MALSVEDGTGLSDAESVLSVADLDAMAIREAWAGWPASGLQVPEKEAAARKGTRWAESRYRVRLASEIRTWWGGGLYAGPKTLTQALLFPMTGFIYPDGRTLEVGEWLPREWALVCGLATLRAFLGTLSPDLKRGGQVISKTVGPLSTTWSPSAPAETSFPEIDDAFRPLWASTHVLVTR